MRHTLNPEIGSTRERERANMFFRGAALLLLLALVSLVLCAEDYYKVKKD